LSYDGNAMLPEKSTENVVTELRWLAASDPKQARTAFCALLHSDATLLDEVLKSASRPGDGRLRQMIATVFRTDVNATSLEPWLRQWIEIEPDEFTKSAIAAALSARAPEEVSRPTARNQAVNVVEAYRYVADRLCHRVRNALSLPSAQIIRLEHVAREVGDPKLQVELMDVLAGLQKGFRRISRNVEFDTGDDYLTWQSVPIVGWLESNANEFASRFGHAKLVVTCDHVVRRVTVRATRFFLETAFGNLWSNAVQAVEPPCQIDVQCAVDSQRGQIEMLVIDNGPGFPEAHLETAFQQVFSTKSDSRGRGLLEIADAIVRLQGTVRLTKSGSGEYRIRLSIPVESS
jgi:signal transduction histidine kinase